MINISTDLEESFESKCKTLIDDFEKNISLAIIDDKWKDHLKKMDELKQSVQLAVHEQKDPLLIYKFEAYELFKNIILMMANSPNSPLDYQEHLFYVLVAF